MGLFTASDSELTTVTVIPTERGTSDEESPVGTSSNVEPKVYTVDPHVASLLRMTGFRECYFRNPVIPNGSFHSERSELLTLKYVIPTEKPRGFDEESPVGTS